MRLKYHIIFLLSIFLLSCSKQDGNRNPHLNAYSFGQKIELPKSLSIQILTKQIDYDFSNPDFTILVQIDSTDCSPCEMKLKRWTTLINKCKQFDDLNLNFIMLINEDIKEEALKIINHDLFLHPVSFINDSAMYRFDNGYNVYLLDSENRIILIGNPLTNPKIEELYFETFNEYGSSRTNLAQIDIPFRNFGIVKPGESVSKTFLITNVSKQNLKIQAIIPSCDCINTAIDKKEIPHNKSATLSLTFTQDSTTGYKNRYVDIFYEGIEQPDRIGIYGYVTND